jgi:tetratricopeptide (TPR) repeat protein
VRVNVTVQIDTAVVARQIDALRKNEHATEELQQARAEAERLKQEVEAKGRELAALKSKAGAEPLLKEREQAFAKLDAQDLVVRAWRPVGERGGFVEGEPLPAEDRASTKAMILQAITLDPANARAHAGLGRALLAEGRRDDAAREFRMFLKTVKPTPANQRLIEKVQHKLQELDGPPNRPAGPRRKPRDFDR